MNLARAPAHWVPVICRALRVNASMEIGRGSEQALKIASPAAAEHDGGVEQFDMKEP